MFRATSHRSIKFSSGNPAEPSPAKDGMLGSEARRIAEGSNASGHVASDNTTRTDHCVIANSDARQDYCAAPDPYVTPDADRATKLQPSGPLTRIAWVGGGGDLNPS